MKAQPIRGKLSGLHSLALPLKGELEGVLGVLVTILRNLKLIDYEKTIFYFFDDDRTGHSGR